MSGPPTDSLGRGLTSFSSKEWRGLCLGAAVFREPWPARGHQNAWPLAEEVIFDVDPVLHHFFEDYARSPGP